MAGNASEELAQPVGVAYSSNSDVVEMRYISGWMSHGSRRCGGFSKGRQSGEQVGLGLVLFVEAWKVD